MARSSPSAFGRSASEIDRHRRARPGKIAYVERLIASVRRERVDHVVVFGKRHLRHLLLSCKTYYNETRTHLSLNKDVPSRRAVQATGRVLCPADLGRAPSSIWQDLIRDTHNHLIVFSADHLQRILGSDLTYDNSVRTHLTLDQEMPIHRPKKQRWFHSVMPDPRRAPSSIFQNLIFGMHRMFGMMSDA